MSMMYVLKNLKVNKACGPDAVSPRLHKEGAPVLAGPLSILLDSLISKSYFPSQWKEPLSIRKRKNFPQQIIDLFHCKTSKGKCMERCVHKQVYSYIRQHNRLTSCQSGFIPGDATTVTHMSYFL